MRQGVMAITVAMAVWVVAPAVRAADTPLDVLKRSTAKLTESLKLAPGPKRDGKVKKIVRQFLDYDSLARTSLGKHWKARTPRQRKEFVKLLREVIEKRILSKLTSSSDFTEHYKAEGDSKRVEVVYRIPNKPDVEVVYDFARKKRRWMVVNVIADDTNVRNNYRRQFHKIITKHGYDNLIERLEKQLKKDDET